MSFSPRLHSRRWRVPLLVPACIGVAVLAIMVVVSMPRSGPRPSDPSTVARRIAEAPPDEVVTTTTDAELRLLPLLPGTAASPLRVLEIGDSLGIDLGDQLQARLDAGGSALTTMASVGDSGLSNVTYVNWPAHLASLLATDRPQIVVVFIGANDDQGIDVNGVASAPGTLAWVAGYAHRVDEMLTEAAGAGARVVWVGMPPMENPDLNIAVQREDVIYQRETETFAGTLYVPSTGVLGNTSGLYEATGADVSGQQVALRTADGVHLTPAGADALARTVIDAMDHRWRLSVSAPTLYGSTATG